MYVKSESSSKLLSQHIMVYVHTLAGKGLLPLPVLMPFSGEWGNDSYRKEFARERRKSTQKEITGQTYVFFKY